MDFSTTDREEILKNLLLIGDRGQFIEEFLRMESSKKLRMEADADEECAICQEKYSILTSAEYKIQLPCCGKHTMGSKCIETWLKQHNSCPLCRQEFFPDQGIHDDYNLDDFDLDEFGNEEEASGHSVEDYPSDFENDEHVLTIEDEYQQSRDVDLPEVLNHCQDLCRALGLHAPGDLIMHIATQVAQRVCYYHVTQSRPTRVDNLNQAAACVYMASHLTCQRLTMYEIASGVGFYFGFHPLTEASIGAAYRYLDEAAFDIVDQELCQLLTPVRTDDFARVMLRLPMSQISRGDDDYRSQSWVRVGRFSDLSIHSAHG